MALTIVGLGPGAPELLTRQAWDVLSNAPLIYLRTKIHPTVAHLPTGAELHSFDDVYEQIADFADVYATIVDRIASASGEADVVYAVPGDPLIGEGTVTQLLAVCRVKNIEVEIIHGVSFVEPMLEAIEIDGITGIQLIDALDIASLHHPSINPDRGALIAQIYSQQVASDVKLTLMNQYPDAHQVTLVRACGTSEQRIDQISLFEIDRLPLDHLTSLYVPPLSPERVSSYESFQETIAYLRAPEGCPWDQEQTHLSLRPFLIEEAYEALDAIDSGDTDRIREELGDLLLQIALHSQIAVDDGEFTMADIIQQIDAKIKRRHPHVWGDVEVNGEAEKVAENWEKIKAEERAANGGTGKGILDGISKSLPALAQAYEYDRRAARVGFDWPNEQGVIDKIHEEMVEVYNATTPGELEHEIGDLLLSVAVYARWKKVAPEDALRAACQRFYTRFGVVERLAQDSGRAISAMTTEELDSLWGEAKRVVG